MEIGPEGLEGFLVERGQIAICGEGFGEDWLGDSGEDVGDIEFEGVRRGQEGQTGRFHRSVQGWDRWD